MIYSIITLFHLSIFPQLQIQFTGINRVRHVIFTAKQQNSQLLQKLLGNSTIRRKNFFPRDNVLPFSIQENNKWFKSGTFSITLVWFQQEIIAFLVVCGLHTFTLGHWRSAPLYIKSTTLDEGDTCCISIQFVLHSINLLPTEPEECCESETKLDTTKQEFFFVHQLICCGYCWCWCCLFSFARDHYTKWFH